MPMLHCASLSEHRSIQGAHDKKMLHAAPQKHVAQEAYCHRHITCEHHRDVACQRRCMEACSLGCCSTEKCTGVDQLWSYWIKLGHIGSNLLRTWFFVAIGYEPRCL